MTTADVIDRVVLRILAFLAAQRSDAALSGHVFGHRLERPGAWGLRPSGTAWLDFKGYQLASLSRRGWGYSCVSDLSGFYLAIDTDLMCASLQRSGIGDRVVVPIHQLLRAWQKPGELRGLPIGGEASAVLSNSYLLSIDELLSGSCGDYAIYGDDFTIFDVDVPSGRAVLQLLDHCLNAELSLTRNAKKTMEFFDPEEAADYIDNRLLASIDAIEEDGETEEATELLYLVWDLVMASKQHAITEMHFVLRRLAKRNDRYAVPGLLDRLDLLQIDPKHTIDYLIDTSANDQDIAEQLCSLLAAPPTVTTEPLHLHICRFLASAERTAAIGGLTERVLDDRAAFRPITRAMAAQARCRCPGWKHGDAIDRADAEPTFAVRRSLIGTTRGMTEHVRTRRLALRELARRDPALNATAAWALAA